MVYSKKIIEEGNTIKCILSVCGVIDYKVLTDSCFINMSTL